MTSNITIKKNDSPKLKRPEFSVDCELHPKLNNFEITSLMNKSNFTIFLGKPGSGKSTLSISMLNTPALFRKCYHTIILFCPTGSRNSIKGDFWDYLPEEQIYDEVNPENLQEAYEVAQENSENGYQALIIFDDVQKYFKEAENEKLLLHFCNNRRHSRLSLWFACQNFMQISRKIRMGITDAFIFKVSKTEMENIFTELIEDNKDKFTEILKLCYQEPHSFMYINTSSQRIFSNWDEIIF